MTMKVVGITTQQYVYVASQERKFRINEVLIIEDPTLGPVKGEVIETQSFNHFIPLASERTKMVDSNVLDSLRQFGYAVDDEETNIAKVRTLSELIMPMKTGSNVRLPSFAEIEKMLISTYDGWNMGVLRGTEEIAPEMPLPLQNKGVLFNLERGIQPYNGVPFIFDYKSMYQYPHVGLFGGSGSGKSFSLRVMLEEIMLKRIPGIALDPHFELDFKDKMEGVPTEHRKDFDGRYEVLTLGQDVGINFTDLMANDLVNIISSSSGGFTDNMDNAVRTIHRRDDTVESFSKKLDSLVFALDNPREVLKDYDNRDTLNDTLRGEVEFRKRMLDEYGDKGLNTAGLKGIQWRFNKLVRIGLFNRDIRPVLEGLKARKLMVIRGSMELLKIFSAYMVRKTYELRRNFKDRESQGISDREWFPPFCLITDEAHNFAPKAFETASKTIIREIAQEGRKYGVFLVLATQRPVLMDDTIIAQLNTKFILRTVRGQDIKLLAEETDISPEDSARLPYLPSGEAFVSSAVIGRTVSLRVRCAITKSPNSMNPFDELEMESASFNNPFEGTILSSLPFSEGNLLEILKKVERETGAVSSINELKGVVEEMVLQGKIKSEQGVFGKRYTNV